MTAHEVCVMGGDYPIEDYDDAYANGPHITDSADFPLKWASRAKAFRSDMASKGLAEIDVAYGPRDRHRYDLFRPDGSALGLVVFIHGGYWKAFDKSYWSHLAAGANAHGYAVAVPSYTLAPEARLAEIASEMAQAITHAAQRVAGPVILTGHSAGGQIIARLVSKTTPLPQGLTGRIARVLPISGVHDLRPLLRTGMGEVLRLDEAEAWTESPLLLEPLDDIAVSCWVGADERPEFVRQNQALHIVWKGFGVRIDCVEEAGRHHFDVIDGLSQPGHRLTRTLLDL